MKLRKKTLVHKIYVIGKLILLISIIFLFIACEKALEPQYPDFLLSEEAVFENASTIDAAMANIYSGIRDNSPFSGNPNGMSVLFGLYTDELQHFNAASQTDNAFYNHTVQPTNNAITDLWNSSYSLIYSVNSMITGLENSPLPMEEKEAFLGEAHFLRGYFHFYLGQIFGDIPYIETTDHVTNAAVSRMDLEEINKKVEIDLLKAVELLPEMDNSGERVRPSKGTAHAMLARLYLQLEDWAKAFTESNLVIGNGAYIWQSDLNHVFLKESPSTIWQLKTQMEGYPTSEGQTFIFDVGPPSLYALSPEFLADFELGDLRKEAWTRNISVGAENWSHPYKYKQNMFAPMSTEYSILFRLAEQYLIRAEASIQLGNLQEAKSDINTIRSRAGLTTTIATTREELNKELLHQRRYELFTEQGNRWFYLKRKGLAGEVLSPIKVGWKATDILLPLPEQELLLNPNLNPQNPGY